MLPTLLLHWKAIKESLDKWLVVWAEDCRTMGAGSVGLISYRLHDISLTFSIPCRSASRPCVPKSRAACVSRLSWSCQGTLLMRHRELCRSPLELLCRSSLPSTELHALNAHTLSISPYRSPLRNLCCLEMCLQVLDEIRCSRHYFGRDILMK